jgi:hypothetical protein
MGVLNWSSRRPRDSLRAAKRKGRRAWEASPIEDPFTYGLVPVARTRAGSWRE